MTTTPFVDLKSEDILSAHISGLQHAINKIETVLNEKTTVVTGHALIAVTDQADVNLHNLIYEGTVRNWLSSPAPVVKRNGTVVATSEYKIEPAYGVVVFYAQQNPTDNITADITYVSGGSSAIDAINQSIQDNSTNIGANTSAISTLQGLTTLNKSNPVGQYIGHNVNGGVFNTNVNAGSNNQDAFPIFVTEQTIFDKMMIEIGTGTAATPSATKIKLALYADNNFYPGTLVAECPEITDMTAGVKEVAFTGGDKTVQPGIYWISRWQNGNTALNRGISAPSARIVYEALDTSNYDGGSTTVLGPAAGVRVPITYDGISRNPFWTIAQGAKYLYRAFYASPWIHRKA